MPKRVEILHKQRLFDKFIFRIDEAQLRFEKYNGQLSEPITRLNLDRGDSAAAVVYDPDSKSVFLTEQFRFSTYEKGPGWLLEIPAGMVETKEDENASIKRELEEEIGYRVTEVRKIMTFYLSPGGTSERIHLFYAKVSSTHKVSQGGGLAAEGEDIRTVKLTLKEALAKIDSGEICDAKTIIGLQWLQAGNAT